MSVYSERLNHAPASRSRNRPPRARARDGGARFDEVLAHRGDLRWPLPKDFAKRLKGQTVSGLGRRAKYLWPICRRARCW